MKKLALVLVCLLSLSLNSLAQTSETFDLATFQPPVGWQRQSKDGVLIFSTSDKKKGTYAMVMLFRSGDSSGNAQKDFDADWEEFIVGQLAIKYRPEIEPARNVDGWTIIAGAAAFQNETGKSAVVMNTYSGYGKKLSAVAIFNSQDHLPAVEAFLLSIKLRKPEARSNKPTQRDNE